MSLMKETQMRIRVPNPDDWMDAALAREHLGVTPSTLYLMLADGRLRSFKIGGARLFWRDDVCELAAARDRAAGRPHRH